MAGQKRREVRLDADRPHARAATAVRNAKGLVKIHMAHVGADVARTREPYERVEICAVEIDLAAVRMCDRQVNDALAEALLSEPIEPFHGGQILHEPGLEELRVGASQIVAIENGIRPHV